MQTITITKKAALLLVMGFMAVGAFIAAGSVAWAGHQFADVSDTHTHHAGISYVKDAGITAGCGDGTNYCPEDLVKRSQMATFLHRASGNAPGIAPSVNAKALSGHDWAEINARFAALENKLQFVSIVDTNTMRISGANLQVVSGMGSTDAGGNVNGLGNLIVGYNENYNDDRTGSHNLVVGPLHSYSEFGGIVGGYNNTVSGWYGSVTGGMYNIASGTLSSVTGGKGNQATGGYASVTGGLDNGATGESSTVSGGYLRWVTGERDWRGGGTVWDQ